MKIYTYSNPFKLTQASFWKDIAKYPHLTVSQTLVQGLTSLYGRNEFSFIYTIDDFIKNFYKTWENEPENNILQYNSISNEIDKIVDPKLKSAMKFNQREMMDAIRFLIELDIEPKDLEKPKLTKEQERFLELYDNIKDNFEWKALEYKEMLDPEELAEEIKATLLELLNGEVKKSQIQIDNFKGRKKRNKKKELEYLEERYNEFEEGFDEEKIEAIVLHGVHRFTPIILRTIRLLEKLDIEVIFLINYIEDYGNIFSTWEKVYGWTNQSFINDRGLEADYKGNRLGVAIGELLQGNIPDNNFPNIEFIKYDNLTTFGDFVADIFDKASIKISGGEEKVIYGTSTLSKMQQQFYAPSNSEINELLKAYFPKQFGEKHFLSYPIGQFILGIYHMWDDRDKTVKIREKALKECLTVNFFKVEGMPNPIEIYNKIKLYLSGSETIDEFIASIGILMDIVKKIENKSLASDDRLEDLKIFSFYSVSYDELFYFQDVINSIHKITRKLFDDSTDGFVNYKNHYKQLIDIISDLSNKASTITQKEIELVERVKMQFENIDKLEIEGSIEDLKETLHFYLSQKKNEDSGKWIVRNFEQIDGGILLSQSKRQKRPQDKIYHFPLLSDEKMKVKMNDLLSWPLNEAFFEVYRSRDNSNKNLDIVLTSFREYSNFLRYSLFYGTYYLKNEIHLSYIENSEGQKENPYFLLTMLNIKPKDFDINRVLNFRTIDGNNQFINSRKNIRLNNNEIKKIDCQTFSLCPYRYLVDSILDENNSYENEYQCKLAFVSTLFKNSWRSLENKPLSEVKRVVEEESEYLKPYFSFWDDIEFIDFKNRVIKYLVDRVDTNGLIESYDAYYMDIRRDFLYGKVTEAWGEDDENLVASLFNYRDNHNGRLNRSKTIEEIEDYLNNKEFEKYPENVAICEYCKSRELCLHNFKAGDFYV